MSHEEIQQDVASGRSGPPWKLIALLLLIAGLAAFFFQNGQDSEVNFLWLGGSWPQWIVIGISVIIGVLLDRLGTWQWRRARSRPR